MHTCMTSPSPSPSSAASLNPMQLDAKNIYVTQLSEVVGPHIQRTMASILSSVCQESGSKVMLRFQGALRAIPLWNSEVIRGHAAAIEAKAPYLERLIAVTFLSFVKVMSSVKLRENDRPNIRIKLPTTDAFVHKVFINVARDFYALPSTPVEEYEGMRAAVERAIRDMLPIEDILNAYLGTAVDGDNTVSPTLEDDARPVPVPVTDDAEDETPGYRGDTRHDDTRHDAHDDARHDAHDDMRHDAHDDAHHDRTDARVDDRVPDRPRYAPEDTRTISIPPVAKDDDLFSDADDEGADWKTPRPHAAPPGPVAWSGPGVVPPS